VVGRDVIDVIRGRRVRIDDSLVDRGRADERVNSEVLIYVVGDARAKVRVRVADMDTGGVLAVDGDDWRLGIG
jgi:hypothetical protein